MAETTFTSFRDFIIIGQVEESGKGLHVGVKSGGVGDLLLRTYNVGSEDPAQELVIDRRIFNGLAHFILQELLTRDRKCSENSPSQIK